MMLLVPWAAAVRRDRAPATSALLARGVFFWAMRPELRQYAQMLDDASDPSRGEIAREYGTRAGLGRAPDRWSAPALVGRLRRESGPHA